MKQKKKDKICFVIYIAGKRIFFIYDVIVKQKIYKRPTNYYLPRPDFTGEHLDDSSWGLPEAHVIKKRITLKSITVCVCVYYCSTYYKAVRGGGGGWRGEDMCYERLRAEASVN